MLAVRTESGYVHRTMATQKIPWIRIPEASALIDIEQMDFRRQIARVALELKVDSSFQSPEEQMNTTLGVPSDILVDAMFKDREVLQALAHRYQISVLYVKQLGDVRTILTQNLGLLRSELGLE